MTTRQRRAASVLASVVIGAVGLSACGAKSISASGSSSTSGSTKAVTALMDKAPAADPAAAVINAIQANQALSAKVPESIRSRGLSFSTSVGYPPMEIWAKDGKTPIGVDPSLGRAIARVLGLQMKITDEDFNAQIPGLLTGRYDMVMTSMTDNKTREKKITFVDYVQAGAGFLVKKGNPKNLTTSADLCGHTVSVVDNGSSLAFTQGYSKQCTAAGKKAINILRFTGDQDAFLALKSGRADANVTDWVVAAAQAAIPSQKVQAYQLPGTESPWGIAMNPDNKEFIAAVQGALNELISNGDYKKILAAYHMEGLAVSSATINKAIS